MRSPNSSSCKNDGNEIRARRPTPGPIANEPGVNDALLTAVRNAKTVRLAAEAQPIRAFFQATNASRPITFPSSPDGRRAAQAHILASLRLELLARLNNQNRN